MNSSIVMSTRGEHRQDMVEIELAEAKPEDAVVGEDDINIEL